MNISVDIYNKCVSYLREDIRNYVLKSNYDDDKKVSILKKVERTIPDNVVKEYMLYKVNTCNLFEFFTDLNELYSADRENFLGMGRYVQSVYRRLLDGIANVARTLASSVDDRQVEKVLENLELYKSELLNVQSTIDTTLRSVPKIDFGRIYYRPDSKGVVLSDQDIDILISNFGRQLSEIISIFNKHVIDMRKLSGLSYSDLDNSIQILTSMEANRISFYISYVDMMEKIYDGKVSKNSLEVLKAMDTKILTIDNHIKEARSIFLFILNKVISPVNSKGNFKSDTAVIVNNTGEAKDVVNKKDSFYSMMLQYLNPKNWNAKYLAVGAGVLGIAILAYTAWKRWMSTSCEGLTGRKLNDCKIRAIDKAIEKSKDELYKCDKSLSPIKCKSEVLDLIKKWNDRKQEIYRDMLKNEDV